MALFDRTITIQAPPEMVWEEANQAARKGTIVREETQRLVVATETGMGYVYLLSPQADGSTRLRHSVGSAAAIQAALSNGQDMAAALDALVRQPDSPGAMALDLLLTLVKLSPDALGERQQEEIRKKAESVACRAKWTPAPVASPVSELLAAPQSTEAASPVTALAPPDKPPWNPTLFTGMALVFSFAASGILAGLNWRRLGKPQYMAPTILLSVVGFVVMVGVLMVLPLGEGAARGMGYLINIGLGGLLTYLQRAAFREWTATHGVPTAQQSGYLVPAAVGLGTLAVVIVLMFSPLVGMGLAGLAVLVALAAWLASRLRCAGEQPGAAPVLQMPETASAAERAFAQEKASDLPATFKVYGAGLVLSCFSPSFYYHVARRRVAHAVGFFLLFSLLLTLVQMAYLNMTMLPMRAAASQAFAAGHFPEITISHGVAVIHGPEPFVVYDKAGYLVALDTTGRYTVASLLSGKYSEGGFLLTKTSLIAYDPEQGDPTVIQLSDLQGVLGEPAQINDRTIQSWISVFEVLAGIGLIIWNIPVRLVYLAPLALVVWGVAAGLRKGTPFAPVIITGIYALVPAFYAQFMLGQIAVGFCGLFTFVFVLAWALGLAAALSPGASQGTPSLPWVRLGDGHPLRLSRAVIGLPLVLNLGLEAIFHWNAWYVTWPLALVTLAALLAVSAKRIDNRASHFIGTSTPNA